MCHFTQPRRPVETRHQRILQGLRDVQLCQRAREHVGVAACLEHPRTEDGLGQLLDVERHAVGFGDDMIDHLAGQRLAAGQMIDHRLDLRPLQAVQCDRRHVRALRPGRRQFGPIGSDHQQCRRRRLLDQHAQRFQRRRIGPVQILPYHQHRGALGRFDQPGNDRIERRIALLLRRHRKARIAVLGHRHGHQIGEQPHARGERQGFEAGEPGFELRQVLRRGILRRRALAVETHENWLEQHRYLNMDDLREHKKEALRRAA